MLEKTPFIQAVESKNFEEAIQLFNQGARIPDTAKSYDYPQFYDSILRNKGYDLLMVMADAGTIERDIYALDDWNNSIFSSLLNVRNADEDYLVFLKEFVAGSENINDEVNGHTLLSYAIEKSVNPSIFQALIEAGCSVNFRTNAEDNLLHLIIKKHGITPDNLETYTQILLTEGVDINDTNKVGQTALHLALNSNKKSIVDTLLAHGAQPNLQDSNGISAYHIAIAHKFDLEVYDRLSQYETMDFEQRNNDGVKALHEYLRMIQGQEEEHPKLLLRLLEDGADLNSTSPHYQKEVSGWDWITKKKASLFEQVLAHQDLDIDHQDDAGNTLLHKVVSVDSNHDQQVARETYKKVKKLLDLGASPNLTNNAEQTPMMIAAEDNLKNKTVELLLLAQQKEN